MTSRRARKNREQAAQDGGGDLRLDPRFLAAVDMLRRTGSQSFQIRYDDEQDPIVWVAVCEHYVDENGNPVDPTTRQGERRYDAAAGMDPVRAAIRLAELVIDGGTCVHCGRPAALDENWGEVPLNRFFCWQQYDPELRKFRRACSGGIPPEEGITGA